MGENIFINYRRGEDQNSAGRLYDQLESSFQSESIFIDVDGILPGKNFVEELSQRVAECDIFIAIVGRKWIDVQGPDGNRRLENPNDWVRIEIESALSQNKHVIPVLVDAAEMPSADRLPESLRSFAQRNAVRLTHERFRADVKGLIIGIEKLRQEDKLKLESNKKAEEATYQSENSERVKSSSEGPPELDVLDEDSGERAASGEAFGQTQSVASTTHFDISAPPEDLAASIENQNVSLLNPPAAIEDAIEGLPLEGEENSTDFHEDETARHDLDHDVSATDESAKSATSASQMDTVTDIESEIQSLFPTKSQNAIEDTPDKVLLEQTNNSTGSHEKEPAERHQDYETPLKYLVLFGCLIAVADLWMVRTSDWTDRDTSGAETSEAYTNKAVSNFSPLQRLADIQSFQPQGDATPPVPSEAQTVPTPPLSAQLVPQDSNQPPSPSPANGSGKPNIVKTVTVKVTDLPGAERTQATGVADDSVPQPSAVSKTTDLPPETYGIGALIEPKKVKTLSVRSDGTLKANQPPVPAADKGFAVQLAAPETEREAQDMAQSLQIRFSLILKDYSLTYSRAQSANKTRYRVRIGDLTRSDADNICQKIKASGGSCFTVHN